MRALPWFLVGLALAVPTRSLGEEGWRRATVSGGDALFAIRAGVAASESRPREQLAAEADFAVGLSDRFVIRPLGLGIAARLGERDATEVLLFTHSGIAGYGDGNLLWLPTFGGQLDLVLGRRHRLVLGATTETIFDTRRRFRQLQGQWPTVAHAGWRTLLGDRFVFSAGVAGGEDWGRPGPSFTPKRSTFVQVGAVIPEGGPNLPLLSYFAFDSLSFDASAALRLDRGLEPQAKVLAGISYWLR